ncbi:glycerol-3-phosphate dehydrogenase/oxidase [Chengkuizengella axinellae]|uniref:Glycerol-3-phosphate dehydrogenase n=1 Tax=Chengkuizengella axinellae TaxID=3064388 RepID=A0ABT9IUP7_9BACL|nr:glycerol-3-phosphate dehydrogenase/oxidase [Chengkuizengella sp. 2205SS18-9]MDP5273084.1 glycerol-3-phosphate dehydrogenase/oxidase [Chengkuizengella sp. 2205SS18-9]
MSNSFSSLNRTKILESMSDKIHDLLVIGGGITGAGIALDSASRGLKTALVEMQDFAAGTSSRSTKLVHGGLRYLKQFEFKIVAEVGKEREIVYRNGPHVTIPEKMLLPIHKGGTFGKFSTSIGLKVYDFLAGVRKSEGRIMLNAEETIRKEPLLKREGLKGSGYYVEYRTDDARLTIEVLKEAVNQGAKAVNYAKAEHFIYKNNKAIGVKVKDQITLKSYSIYAKKIVNATGPWVDKLSEQDDVHQRKKILLTKGVHIVIDQKHFPLKQAIYFDSPDKRMIFAIPRGGKTYVGTTDTFYEEKQLVNPIVTKSDRNYLIDAIQYMFPSIRIEKAQIESSWAGLRALIHEDGKNPSEISRKDEIWHAESGVITIAGGKLTGYRKMAEDVVDLVIKELEGDENPTYQRFCVTQTLPISGGDIEQEKYQEFMRNKVDEGVRLGLVQDQAEQLVARYGSNIQNLYEMIPHDYDQNQHFGLPLDIYLQVIYSVKEEMAVKPIDFFIRRTGALYFNIYWVERWKQPVIDLMSQFLLWTSEQKEIYQQELQSMMDEAAGQSNEI